uniref:Uncharacterized protein n=1 Tax=Physcomitrium patens TaxID=3218 RepID=A0A2K1KQL8_PHYPA|nr:hypothetical protein PHYPA_006981 [Physcomitrium patens]
MVVLDPLVAASRGLRDLKFRCNSKHLVLGSISTLMFCSLKGYVRSFSTFELKGYVRIIFRLLVTG